MALLRGKAESRPMAFRVIPILPVGTTLPSVKPPRLAGQADELKRVLAALEADMARALGARWPIHGWLRELRLQDGEAVLAFMPELCAGDSEAAEVAFATLRRVLPDTDIYVGAAAS